MTHLEVSLTLDATPAGVAHDITALQPETRTFTERVQARLMVAKEAVGQTLGEWRQTAGEVVVITGAIGAAALILLEISKEEATKQKAAIAKQQREGKINDTEAAAEYLKIEQATDADPPIMEETKKGHTPIKPGQRRDDGSWSS